MRSLVEIGQVVLEKKRFKFLKCIFAISPWKRRSPSFEKKTLIPFTQGCFVLSLVEIGPMVLEKKILKSRPCFFSLFRYYLALEKDMNLHLNKIECPSPKDALIKPSVVDISPIVLKNKMKM